MGFGMILGGAAKGYAEGRFKELDAQREAYLEQLRNEREDKRLAQAREFQSSEAEIGRRFTAEENAKTRAASADIVTGADGTSYIRSGDGLKPLKDDKGNPVKTLIKSKDAPAIVDEAEWLITNGLAKDAKEAYQIAKQAKSDDPDKSRAALFKKYLEVLSTGTMGKVDSEKLIEEAKQRTEETLKYLRSADAADDAAPAETPPPPDKKGDSKAPAAKKEADAPSGDPADAPWYGGGGGTKAPASDMPWYGGGGRGFDRTAKSDASTAKPGGSNVTEAELPAAPKDPAARVLGKVYRSPKDGRKIKWTEKGWELAQ